MCHRIAAQYRAIDRHSIVAMVGCATLERTYCFQATSAARRLMNSRCNTEFTEERRDLSEVERQRLAADPQLPQGTGTFAPSSAASLSKLEYALLRRSAGGACDATAVSRSPRRHRSDHFPGAFSHSGRRPHPTPRRPLPVRVLRRLSVASCQVRGT